MKSVRSCALDTSRESLRRDVRRSRALKASISWLLLLTVSACGGNERAQATGQGEPTGDSMPVATPNDEEPHDLDGNELGNEQPDPNDDDLADDLTDDDLSPNDEEPDPLEPEPEPNIDPDPDEDMDPSEQAEWLRANTISHRVSLPLTPQYQVLGAQALANQLAGYDPGSLLRCRLDGQSAYDTAIDDLGGVTWGYGVAQLEDQSKPRFQAGFPDYQLFAPVPGATNDAAGGGVEIVLPDVVAVTESAALFYSNAHGILMIDTSQGEPQFLCAAPLPGRVGQFFFHDGELVAMTKTQNGTNSHLLHFRVEGSELGFVETVDLGAVSILDSRRFNDKLVFYTDLRLSPPPAPNPGTNPGTDASGVAPVPVPPLPSAEHRALRVFQLGDLLVEELNDTLIDTTLEESQLVYEGVTDETELGAVVYESRRFGRSMWASDHYFVVTEEVTKTILTGRETRTYPVCITSHTGEFPYEHCWTEYETRPNPDYQEPDNSGGDRSCQGTTLSDCLKQVARVSNRTIQVPVARHCEERIRYQWVCDASESRSVEYPVLSREHTTQLFIYEYTEQGFVRLDTQVHEITDEGLEEQSPDATVASVTTSAESFDLAVPGAIQTLYFQNGFLYVISEGVLQVYTMGGASMVRTRTLPVVNETLQSSLFSQDKLFLSDFGWVGGDHSTLRVVDLSNPAFPVIDGSSHQLPGGHRSILASDFGIFTVGSVSQFEGMTINALKLGLFVEPYVTEHAYSILATDLNGAFLGDERAQLFDTRDQRFLLPYWGRTEDQRTVHRIGLSRVTSDEIVSEGAVVLPEAAQRTRALPRPDVEYLSFATHSVHWLTPAGSEWSATPVLEYFPPIAVYRLTEEDDYVEVQRLGDRCRLYFSNAKDINQRDRDTVTEEFFCGTAGLIAYDDQLLFGDLGVEFDAENIALRTLSPEELAVTREAIQNRTICLLSLEVVSNPYFVDYENLPDEADLTCVSPEEYEELRQSVTGTTLQ